MYFSFDFRGLYILAIIFIAALVGAGYLLGLAFGCGN